jgi:hypothetical protein
MMKNKMADLRNHLFETLEALKDDDKPMEIERARAICGVAKQLIDTARVEVDFVRAAGETLGQTMEIDTEFFGGRQALPPAPANGGRARKM